MSEAPECSFELVDNEFHIGSRKIPVREVSSEELKPLRKDNVPSIVIKYEGKLYYSKIDHDNPITITPYHLCNDTVHDCKHLIACSEENGGCTKVVNNSKGIELYDFIEMGYETFGTIKDSLIVWCCAHYEKTPPRHPPKITREFLKMD